MVLGTVADDAERGERIDLIISAELKALSDVNLRQRSRW